MLQKARSASSTSLLREAEFARLVLGNSDDESYFHSLIVDVVANRKNPDKIYTGAKALKEQLLSCLSQKGKIGTANVWARLISTELEDIEYLLEEIESRIRAQGDVLGVVELHLADREILSPHIQYVGTNPQKAEIIIAQTLVEFKYELSISSAIGKKYDEYKKPYENDSKIRPMKIENLLDEQIEKKKERRSIQDVMDNINRLENEFLNALYDDFERIVPKELQGKVTIDLNRMPTRLKEVQEIENRYEEEINNIFKETQEEVDRILRM